MNITISESSKASAIFTPSQSPKALETPYSAMQAAYRVDEFIRKSEKSPSINASFNVELNMKGEPRLHCNIVGMTIRRLLRAGAATLPDRYPRESFSPRVLLFSKIARKYALEHYQDEDLVDTLDNVRSIAKRLQQFTKELCERCQSPNHKAKLRRHTKAARKNYRGACLLVDHLFRKHKGGLKVIRLDLGYLRKTALYEFDKPLTTEEVFEHRATFIEELPGLIDNNALAGYIWRTEFKPAKGFHHHLLVFIDAKTLRKDVSIAWVLGEHWVKSITDHRGAYANVNAEYLGRQHEPSTYVGLIRPGDTQRIETLKRNGVDYLCKPDYLIRWVMPEGHRAFGKTAIKPLKLAPQHFPCASVDGIAQRSARFSTSRPKARRSARHQVPRLQWAQPLVERLVERK